MKNTPKNLTSVIVAAFALCTPLMSANAVTIDYYYSQGGYSNGGTVSGTFSANDSNNDGQISSFSSEVTAFTLTFSGNITIPSFSHNFGNLSGLVYDIGSGILGDGSTGSIEGMASNWSGTSGFDFASGLGPTGGIGGRIVNIATGATISTASPIIVTTVPEPESWILLAAGLVALARRAHITSAA